jgi:hypothetical protein
MLNNTRNGWRLATIKLILTGGLLYFVWCLPALASAFFMESKWVCGNHKEVAESLLANGEEVIASGRVGEDNLLMTFWTNNRKEWSLVISAKPEVNISCIVIYGGELRSVKAKTVI